MKVQTLASSMIVFAAIGLTACEEEALTPVNMFMPTDCPDPANCSEGGTKLDAGSPAIDVGFPPDLGEPDEGVIDAGNGTFEAGVPDEGFPDLGPPDTGVPPSPFLNLAGTRPVEYRFDISDYFFGIGGIATELDFVARLLAGQIQTGFAPLDVLIQNLVGGITQSLPWLPQLSNILANIATLFNEMESFGQLTIAQELPATPWSTTSTIHGNEAWSVVYIHLRENCQGQPVTRACSRVPLPVTQTGVPLGQAPNSPDIRFFVEDFSGTLDSGAPEADFRMGRRNVEIELGKVVLFALDTLTELITGGQHQTFQAAVSAAINCTGLGQQVYDFARNTLGLSNILAVAAQVATVDQCNDIIQDAIDAIAGVSTDIDALEFDQYGHAVDNNGDNNADILQVMSAPDTIDGRFRLIGSSDLDGNWASPP